MFFWCKKQRVQENNHNNNIGGPLRCLLGVISWSSERFGGPGPSALMLKGLIPPYLASRLCLGSQRKLRTKKPMGSKLVWFDVERSVFFHGIEGERKCLWNFQPLRRENFPSTWGAPKTSHSCLNGFLCFPGGSFSRSWRSFSVKLFLYKMDTCGC